MIYQPVPPGSCTFRIDPALKPQAAVAQSSPAPPPEPPAETVPATPPVNGTPLLPCVHRGNGKVARLPKPVRDQINIMMLDGFPYPKLIARLGEAGSGLKPSHLSEWKKRGYQEWLQQRAWLEHVSSKSEFSLDVLATPDAPRLHEAGLRLAAACMLDQLTRFASLASDPQPEMFARLVNALSRLTREALSVQKYHDASSGTLIHPLKPKDPKRKLNDEETRAVVDRLDRILGFK